MGKIILRVIMGSLIMTTTGSASPEAQSGLATKLAELVQAHSLPALGAVEFTAEAITRSAVSGRRRIERSTGVTLEDKFHLGSCTKSLTAVLVAKLVEAEVVRWDLTLGEVLSDRPLHDHYRTVTLEMLLAHQGGAPANLTTFKGGSLWSRLWEPELEVEEGRQLVATEVLADAPEAQPGQSFHYSNAGYIIIGAILEKVTGQAWEDLLEDQVFAPLEMTSCGFGAAGEPTTKAPDQPWGHEYTTRAFHSVEPGFLADNPPTLGPAGTVHCSMGDWTRFLQQHMRGFRGESSFLTTASFRKLQEPFAGSDYAPGGVFAVDRDWAGGRAFTHGGSNTMNFAVFWLAPEQNRGFLAVSNAEGPAADAADQVVGWMIQSQ